MTDSRSDHGGRYEWWLTPVTAGLAVLALVIAMAAVLISGTKGTAGESGHSPALGGETTFEVTLKEFSITPASITVPSGKKVTFNVTNRDDGPTSVDGTHGTKMLDPGASETLVVEPVSA